MKSSFYFLSFAIGILVGAWFIGYPIGSTSASLKTMLIWNMDNHAFAQRPRVLALEKEQILALLQKEAVERQRHVVRIVQESTFERLVAKFDPEIDKAMKRLPLDVPKEGRE